MNNKKIIFQVTRTYMMKNRKRTLITFLCILIMVVLMTAVFVGKDTVMGYLYNAVVADSGSWHYQVYDIDKEQTEKIKALDFVEGYAVSEHLGYTDFPQSGDPKETPFLELKSYSDTLFEWMNIKMKDGRYPQNSDEVIISVKAVKDGADIKIGDTIDADCFERYVHAYTAEEYEALRKENDKPDIVLFPVGFHIRPGETLKAPDHFPYTESNNAIEMIHEPTGLRKRLTIVGLMEEPFFGTPGQGGYIALTGTDNDDIGNKKVNVVLKTDLKTKADCFDEIAKILDSSATPEEREAAVNSRIAVNDMLLTFTANSHDTQLNFLMIFCQVFFVVLITAASLILIYNVFSISYQERCRYLGMLSSVGATRKQKRWSVYYEVFSLLCPSIPLGILTGLLVVKAGMAMLYPHFSKIFGTLISGYVAERNYDIPYSLVIAPRNILLIVIFSALAVWISAWIPALKISRIGPVESIRGNDNSMKQKKKGYKSYLGLMLRGKAEKLMGRASVERNRSSAKGIIRSITAFTALTLITAFSAGSIADILKSMQDSEDVLPGTAYDGYAYVFENSGYLDEEWYQSGRNDIINSNEVSGYKEMDITYLMSCIPQKYYNDEYMAAAKQILEKWLPDSSPETIQNYLIGDGNYNNLFSRPWAGFITLKEEDLSKLAEKSGISLDKYEGTETGPVLAYDSLRLTTEDQYFFSEKAHQPAYTEYSLKQPLSVNEGDTMQLEISEYDEEKNEEYEFNVPVTFAGYVNADAVKEYCSLNSNRTFMFISEQTKENIQLIDPHFGESDIEKLLFFDSDDDELLRKLSHINDELGRSALKSTEIFDMTDLAGVITKIANIVAVCFTLMIALICLLNLYNSVMGRCLARNKEIAVLHSMGMTGKQKDKMLMTENIRLLTRALINSAVITLVFVLGLYKIINMKYVKVNMTFPVWVVALTLFVSAAGLMIFTKICYSHNSRTQIIEEIRKESI